MMGFPQALARAAAIVVVVATAAVRPSCGQTIDSSLIEAAKKEGEVVWYTTLIVTQIVRPVASAFEKKYPGIKVSFTPAPFQEVATRIVNEGRSGNVKADLFDGGATFYAINAAGFVAPYKPAAAAAYPAEFKDPEAYWTANIIQVVSPAINTDLVPASDAPKTLQDLLDPKWRGRMAWTDAPSASGPPGFIGAVLLSLGKEKGMQFLTGLAEQRIANIPSNQRVVLDQSIGGQYPLVLCVYNYHAAISAAQGAPVEWLKVMPILTFGSVSMVKNGPHPNATKLFIEFMLSEEGQKIHADAGYIPAHPNVAAKSPALKPDVGKYDYQLVTPEMYNTNAAEWTSIYKKLFQ
jgi:ABC-type Fe3+ transport system substrate-binding protein